MCGDRWQLCLSSQTRKRSVKDKQAIQNKHLFDGIKSAHASGKETLSAAKLETS
jgi:hypothetical protein